MRDFAYRTVFSPAVLGCCCLVYASAAPPIQVPEAWRGAPSVSFGTELDVLLEEPGDEQRVSLLVEEAGYVEFVPDPDGPIPVLVEYFDEDGELVSTGEAVSRVLGPTTLYARLHASTGSGSAEPVAVAFEFHPETDALEPNDSAPWAVPVEVDQWERIALPSAHDLDFVELDAPEDGYLYLETARLPEGLRPVVHLVDRWGELSEFADHVRPLAVTRGSHILCIRNDSPTFSYDPLVVRLRFVQRRDELATFPLIEPGRIYRTDAIEPPNRRGFGIQVEHPSWLYLQLLHPPPEHIDDKLLWGVTHQHDGGQTPTVNGLSTEWMRLLMPGLHTFEVNSQYDDLNVDFPGPWNVAFVLVEENRPSEPDNNTPQGAMPLPLNKKVWLEPSVTNDVDWLSDEPSLTKDVAWLRLEIPGPGLLQVASLSDVRLFAADEVTRDWWTPLKVFRPAKAPTLMTSGRPDRTLHLEEGGTYLLESLGGPLEANFAPDASIGVPEVSGGFTSVLVDLAADEMERLDSLAVGRVSGSFFAHVEDLEELPSVLAENVQKARQAGAMEFEAGRSQPVLWPYAAVAALLLTAGVIFLARRVRKTGGGGPAGGG